MAKKLIFAICSLFLFCCQYSTNIDDFPENGETSVTINNADYVGSAYLSSRKIDQFDFIAINLILNDSTKIEILSEEFTVGIFSCDPTQVERCVIFSLEYEQRPFYSAKEGILNIKKERKFKGEI